MSMTFAEFIDIFCQIVSAVSILAPGVIFFFKLYNRAKDFLHSQKLISMRVEESSKKISDNLDSIRIQIDDLSS